MTSDRVNPIQIIDLPRFLDPRGNLTFLQSEDQVPFDIKRTFWTYDVPGGQVRGGHAYQSNQEVIIALSGSFDVVVDLGPQGIEKYSLNRSYYGLFIPALYWRHLENFSTNAVALTLASTVYDPADYIRDYQQYLKEVHGR